MLASSYSPAGIELPLLLVGWLGLAQRLDGSAVRAPGQPPGRLLPWPRKDFSRLLQPPADFMHTAHVSGGRPMTLMSRGLIIMPPNNTCLAPVSERVGASRGAASKSPLKSRALPVTAF